MSLTHYLELVDWTGRIIIRNDKRGAISSFLPPVLDRLNLDKQEWLKLSLGFEKSYKTFAGRAEKMKQVSHMLGHHRLRTA